MERTADNLLVKSMRQALTEFADESPSRLADWIAEVVDPDRPTVSHLLTDPETSLDALVMAKDLYKLLRVMGTSSAHRRMGRRLYAASIASALVHHDIRISDQSRTALGRAFHYLLMSDEEVPEPVRGVVEKAAALLPRLHEMTALKPLRPQDGSLQVLDGALSYRESSRSAPPPVVKRTTEKPRKRGAWFTRRRNKREAMRKSGLYDPLLGSYFQTRQAYCPACRGVVDIRRRYPNRMLHLWVSLLTIGIWLPIWGLLEVAARFKSWRCVNCRRRIYQAMIS